MTNPTNPPPDTTKPAEKTADPAFTDADRAAVATVVAERQVAEHEAVARLKLERATRERDLQKLARPWWRSWNITALGAFLAAIARATAGILVAGAALVVLACGGNEPPPPAPPAAPPPPPVAASVAPPAPSVEGAPALTPPAETAPAPTPQPPPVASYDGLGSAARIAEIRELVNATIAVVTSPAFHMHLAALKLRPTPDAPADLPGEEVYRSYLGLDAASRPTPVSYAPKCAIGRGPSCLVASCHHQTADTTFPGSQTFLNKCTFERAAARPAPGSDDVEAFACAINTIAHEWTHIIPEVTDATKERYLDRGHKPSTGMLVSYTIGAVAQCTYLEAGDHLPGTFDACVDAAGTFILKTAPCVKGWAKRHAGGVSQ